MVTLLDETPLICILFMTGVVPKKYLETVIDVLADKIGGIGNDGFFKQKHRQRKNIPWKVDMPIQR